MLFFVVQEHTATSIVDVVIFLLRDCQTVLFQSVTLVYPSNFALPARQPLSCNSKSIGYDRCYYDCRTFYVFLHRPASPAHHARL
ncbi:hypothetical protein Dda3937_04510 [Dickeya dadantii 3937]|uniref:Uncharacterized protein n=1 Tax=Dickeya dadantii (strain 3937) TaxID=198628 RepID=E0SGJ5_DICD3|nr:hypothetical protein Dda3937_04510 [Dickeya dadantii 3937]